MTLSLRTFQEGIARLAVAFDAKTDEAKTAVYWDELSDLGDEEFTVAVRRALREWDKPFALPTLGFLRARAPQRDQVAADSAAGRLKRKIGTFAAETRPDVGLDERERAVLRDLGQTVPRLAMMAPAELDKWLTWDFRPAWARHTSQGDADEDRVLGFGSRPALGGGDER